MRVYLGPYSHWFQPGRWYEDWMLNMHGVGEHAERVDIDKYDEVKDKIRKSRIYKILIGFERWLDSRVKRKIKIKIHDYDVWGMDHTLALIIVPMLKLLKTKKMGSPYVDDADVPEELRSTSAPELTDLEKQCVTSDANLHKRWEWTINEMLWAMEQVANEDSDDEFFEHNDSPGDDFDTALKKLKFDKDGYEKWQARKQHGLMLFGKYFEALWD